MELGGLAPFIVHKDADIDAAVDGCTINGANPPSSIVAFLTVSADCSINFLPTPVEPVNVILLILGCLVKMSPASLPEAII